MILVRYIFVLSTHSISLSSFLPSSLVYVYNFVLTRVGFII